jgi:hypothetical protein
LNGRDGKDPDEEKADGWTEIGRKSKDGGFRLCSDFEPKHSITIEWGV